ncbi:MAG TPA: hypothetical protein VFD64_04945 [Gemmatimonadaceae bacterium]|nr:hypothetical protein [Gemmatimonadaceae bacterium]
MTETQQRFLKAIAERVTGDNVTEIRLYPTVRVGPIESGVAIVATKEPMPVAVAEEQVSAEGDLTVDEIRIASARPDRLSILTAHFRHTVKGPDRGKWEFTMVHDADAPIEIVESVVRGVARRSGEDGEPELLSATDFQKALTEPWWTTAQQSA